MNLNNNLIRIKESIFLEENFFRFLKVIFKKILVIFILMPVVLLFYWKILLKKFSFCFCVFLKCKKWPKITGLFPGTPTKHSYAIFIINFEWIFLISMSVLFIKNMIEIAHRWIKSWALSCYQNINFSGSKNYILYNYACWFLFVCSKIDI